MQVAAAQRTLTFSSIATISCEKRPSLCRFCPLLNPWALEPVPLRLWASQRGVKPANRSAIRLVRRTVSCAAGNEESGLESSPEGEIPATIDGLLRRVSSRAYSQQGEQLEQKASSSYALLDTNPWRGVEKAVFVLARGEAGLFTMKTRKDRSDVENELSKLFPKRGSRRGSNGRSLSPAAGDFTRGNRGRFSMHVDTICDGVLVFEDESEAVQYSRQLEREGLKELAVAEIEASEVFDFCSRSRALAIVFRHGSTPPSPQQLRTSLSARKHSLED